MNTFLAGNLQGKRALRIHSCRRENNIKMDLKEIGWKGGLHSSGSGKGKVVGSCEHGNEPSGSIKGGEFLD
jgi:hypothetical protein